MENGGLRPSYDRIDEQEPGPGITIEAPKAQTIIDDQENVCTDHQYKQEDSTQ